MKTKKRLSIMLILSVIIGLFSFGGITASASGFINDIYFRPEHIAVDMANNIPGSYFEVTAHTENGVNSARLTSLSSNLYRATISQTVFHFEFVLKDTNGENIWYAMAVYDSEEFNCVSFEGGVDFPVWERYSSSNSDSVTTEPAGDGMIYFTPNAEWKNATSRFAVRINISGQFEYEELTWVEDDVYCFAEREGATAYIFGALRPTASTANQFLYTAKGTTKPPAGARNHYILNDGMTNQAEGSWQIREVAGGEEPIIPPSDEIVPGPNDEVFYGYSENELIASATLSEALTLSNGSTHYIILFKSVNLSDTVTISGGSYVLDLAGYEINSTAQIPFELTNNASLRIKDSKENGSITAQTAGDSYMFEIQNAKFIIDGGKYETENNGIINQAGSSSQTTINGGSLYAGDISAVSIREGNLYVNGGGFYNGCMEAHISYYSSLYNRNITINNLDTNGFTTLVMQGIQNTVPVRNVGEKVIALTAPDGTTCSQLEMGMIYYIDVRLNINFTEGHSNETIRKGQIYTIPQYEESYPLGMEFEGWKDISTNQVYHVGMEFMPTKDMNFSPSWIDGIIISVSFNANGGTGSMGEMASSAKSAFELPACGFTAPEGKVFDKWQVNGAEYGVGTSVVLNEDTEIFALWKDGIRVAYKANGGVGDDIVTYVGSGAKVILSNNSFTAPEGKSFKKWQVRGTEYSPGSAIYVTEETEILALWKDGYSVIYKPNGGSGATREEEYPEETTIILPENFFTAPENKYFKCWEVNGEEKMPGDPVTVSEETTVLAVWGNVFTVRYIFSVRSPVGGSEYEMTRNDTVIEGESYTFKHPKEWFSDSQSLRFEAYYWEEENGRQYQIGETTTLTGDITINLNYKLILNVSVDPDNDIDDWQYYEALEGDRFTLPGAPENVKIGYIFDCWKNMKTENLYEANDETILTQNATFRAQWKKCEDHSFKDGICEHCGGPENGMIADYSEDTKTASVAVGNAGTYTVVFADYEGNRLANVEYTTVTFTAETKGTLMPVSITKDFNLSTGDKIMLWQNMRTFIPLCEALTIK